MAGRKGAKVMGAQVSRCKFLFDAALLLGVLPLGLGSARADALYTIRDLGTLPGTSMSVATGINNQGQVVGISYNPQDGTFGLPGGHDEIMPPFFSASGNGAQSFLNGNGTLTQIYPKDGLATAINDSGVVIGGPYSSINSSGQYVGGPASGVNAGSNSPPNRLVSGGTTTDLGSFTPYSINNAGQIAGFNRSSNFAAFSAAIDQGGQLKDLSGLVTQVSKKR
jgi:uncharacterized membrane protein